MPRREIFQDYTPADVAPHVYGPACDLLALFMADQPVHRLLAKHAFPGIEFAYAEYREERIFKLLIEIATSYRLTSWQLSAEKKQKEKQKEVGVLYVGEIEDGEPLSIHEACNKIIHAEMFSFETKKIRNVSLAYIRDQILFEGKRGRKEWLATLWIPEFCEAILTMPYAFDDELVWTKVTENEDKS